MDALTNINWVPLEALVAKIAPGVLLEAAPVEGGFGTRRHFRIKLSHGGSAIAMFEPVGAKSDEIQHGENDDGSSFLEVRALLESRGIDVPKLFGHASGDGWTVLEDLGDDTLARYGARHPEAKRDLYRQAAVDLARAQRQLEALPPDSVVASRILSAQVLRRELESFRFFAIERMGASRLSAMEETAFQEIIERLSTRIASFPRVFTHRDYQPRNLMRRTNGNLAWIDFQDALVGPRAYDLASLLSGRTQDFDRRFMDDRLDDYAHEANLDPAARRQLGAEFDWVIVQRKLKDAGRYAYVDAVRGDPSFVRYMAPALKKAQRAMLRLREQDPDMAVLEALLRKALPAHVQRIDDDPPPVH